MDLTKAPLGERDVADLKWIDWPQRALTSFQGIRENRFQVIYRQSVLDEIHLHGQGSNDIEVCGVLLGTGYQDSQGPYMLVDHCIRGNGAKAKATNVTFTAETWAHIQNIMDRDFPAEKMVGWYHTHPGFGIFLSDMDIFICDNFFNLSWQMAFVYDPLGGDEGNFIWKSGKPTRDAMLIEDDVTPAAAAIPLISVAEATIDPFEAAVEAKMLEVLIRVRRLEKRQKGLVILMVFFAAFVIMLELGIFPAAGLQSMTRPATQPATLPLVGRPSVSPPVSQ